MRRKLAAGLWFLLLPNSLAAEKPWQAKPPAAWTQEEALEVLNDSPWAQRVTVYQFTGRMLGVLPNGRKVIYRDAPNRPPRLYSVEPERLEMERVRALYGVRWSSAEIVQQALERLGKLSLVLTEAQGAPPELSPDHFVLTVRVLEPPEEAFLQELERPFLLLDEGGRPVRQAKASAPDLFSTLGEEELRTRAQLRWPGGGRLQPERVLRHGMGMNAAVSFFFRRQMNDRATVPPGSQQVEFLFKGQKGDELKSPFNLQQMLFGARPDF